MTVYDVTSSADGSRMLMLVVMRVMMTD